MLFYSKVRCKADLAQLVEQRIRNAWVWCSNHQIGTILKFRVFFLTIERLKMRKFFLVFLLLFVFPVFSQDMPSFIKWVKTVDEQGVHLGENKASEQDERYIQKILSVPEQLRIYLYPSLFSYPVMFSEKVLSHPEIMKYKGKYPNEWQSMPGYTHDVKTLEFLHPVYYPILAPEEYKSEIILLLK